MYLVHRSFIVCGRTFTLSHLVFIYKTILKSYNCKRNSYWIHTYSGHDHYTNSNTDDILLSCVPPNVTLCGNHCLKWKGVCVAVQRQTVWWQTVAMTFHHRESVPHLQYCSSRPLLDGCVQRRTNFHISWSTWSVTTIFHCAHNLCLL